MINFLLGDMVNRVKMSSLARIVEVVICNNKINAIILNLLLDLGYIYNHYIVNFKYLRIYIFFKINYASIRQFFIISRPSSKVYLKSKEIKGAKINNFNVNTSFFIFSTHKGVITDLECKFVRIGGEFSIVLN